MTDVVASVVMFDATPHDRTNIDSDELEALIRDAGHYVRPGNQLRGRILDAVATRRLRRASWRQYFRAVTVSMSVALVLLMLGRIGLSVAPRGRSATELQDQAARRAVVEGVTWEWALTEIVYDWRRARTGKGIDDDVSSSWGRQDSSPSNGFAPVGEL